MQHIEQNLVVVLGMHRSGTSALTRSLQVLGVGLGDNLMPSVEGNNAKGFWEDLDLNAINIEMLRALKSDWHHLRPIDEVDVEKLKSEGFFARAVHLMRSKVGSTGFFGFKDPRVAMLLPFWKQIFSHCGFNVSYVLALRNPRSVAKSLESRDGFEPEKSYSLWLGHVITSLQFSGGSRRVIVDYDRLMQSPDHELKRIAASLGLDIIPQELEKYKVEFLDTTLRHTTFKLRDLVNDDACPPLVRDIYATLVDVSADRLSLDAASLKAQLEVWSGEFRRIEPLLRLADKLYVHKEELETTSVRLATLSQELSARDDRIQELSEETTKLRKAIEERDRMLASLRRDLEILRHSFSWRVTAPLRKAKVLLRVLAHTCGGIGRRYHHIAALPGAILPAVRFYQGSWRLAISRVAGVFRREGIRGVIRRAHILSGKSLAGGTSSLSAETLYGEVPPPAPGFTPRVSIIVPNFNHAAFLPQRLESIYRQTYPHTEVILLDDCSQDGSVDVLKAFAERYPDKTVCHFNETNSGGVFNQWRKGLELATGDLVWIAESDDYCSDNFLEELVRCFQNEGVKLAFARTEFVRGTPEETVWSLEDYLHDLGMNCWDRPFIQSAHAMVNSGWIAKNLVPNVSSALFRHPGRMELFEDQEWLRLRLCGDWIFYLTIIRGGLIAYSPDTTNFYRQHVSNTSVGAQKQDIYYREHEIVAKYMAAMYHFDEVGLKRQEEILYNHWCTQRGNGRLTEFRQLYDLDRIRPHAETRRPNLLMAVYALAAGGGETFPIMLANLLYQKGYAVTLLNCGEQPTEPGVRSMLSAGVAVLELENLEQVGALCTNMGIEIVHSHHAWVDMSLAMLLLGNSSIKQVVTTHGMYELMTSEQLQGLMPLLRTRVDAFVYTATKNLLAFPSDLVDSKIFSRIDNALPAKAISAIAREDLAIAEDDFVVCLVSRAIPEKGWTEAIEAVGLANQCSTRKIQLLLIGEGPEFNRLQSMRQDDHVHFLGFQSNIRDYFAASDIGFLPSRFKGESAPLVLIDCILSGKPVLASNIGEIAGMLETPDGPAGALFDLEDWEIDIPALADLLARLADDHALYRALLARVQSAAARFEISAMVERYEQVYRAVFRPDAAIRGEHRE
ncbi:hypothetical protein PMI09_00556 [Rhizobium sp. CF122]|uniref:glycosyltransferase n=1 Tax=Rhizobium sp. CF122 TaxID=1144312 RepID=UPI00027185FC|nr:glycosyltransferase [Rhizobium sp. CF122]EJL58063.1 hypothetical protein PMI09_00556 [Rhizobium sp. CF122]